MLNRKDRDYLNKKLYVPIAVRDMLRTGGKLRDEDKYSLHEIISNFQPDSALLAMATATLEIIDIQGYRPKNLKFLRGHCERIVNEYGPLWLEHARQEKINDTLLFETLAKIPDDLESLAELLDSSADFLRRTDRLAAGVLDVFAVQAGAQALVAAEYVDVLDTEEGMPDLSATPEIFGGNVIPFPLHRA